MNPPLSRRAPRLRTVASAALLALAAGVVATSASTAAAADIEPLILSGSTSWNYLEDNTDPAGDAVDPLIWTLPAFDDSGWKNGTGAFGAKRGLPTGIGGGYAVDTLLTQYIDGANEPDVPTFFFRTSFDLSAEQVDGWKSLIADVVYDDALVIYVNGTKVAGYEDDGITQNLQYGGENGADPDRAQTTIDSSALVPGENTIAVALHQVSATSSDIYFDLRSLTPVSAATPAVISDVVMNIGASQADRNLSWYSDSGGAEQAQVALASDLVGGSFPPSAESIDSVSGDTTDGQQYHHADLTGLAPSTSYGYRVGSAEDGWSPVYEFSTGAFSGDYSFLFIGDSQLGASGNLSKDAAGWANTLDTATSAFPDTSFILSAGDQVNTANSEDEYAAFLTPAQLKSLPLAPNIGNHDVASVAYEQHFNVPNVDYDFGKPDANRAGGDYWFIYNDTLFISFNTNDMDDARHAAFAKKILDEHGAEAKWKVVTFHHSVYSVAAHSTDSDIITRRAELPPAMSALDVDLVMMGHDHVYVRSYLMSGTTPVDADKPVTDEVDPKGDEVLYVTANSSSGSKYYDIKNIDFGFDAVQNQEYTPNYTNVDVKDDSISLTTYRSKDRTVVDKVTLNRSKDSTPPTGPTTPVEPTTPGNGVPDPVDSSELTDATRTLVINGVDSQADTVSVTVPRALAGTPLAWYVYSGPRYLGDDPTSDDGTLTLTLPDDLETGIHSLVALRADGTVATWNTFELAAEVIPAAAVDDTAEAGSLAYTGSTLAPLVGTAMLILALGLGAIIVSRRRRTTQP